MNNNKKIEEITEELFDDGKRYGEDIGYAKDDALYELRSTALREARQSLQEAAQEAFEQGRKEERERASTEEREQTEEIPQMKGTREELDKL